MKTYTIDQSTHGVRLDLFLLQNNPELSRSTIQKDIKEGNILVNNIIVKTGYTLKINDQIIWNLIKKEKNEIKPLDLDLEIVYEDDYLAIINKPEGLVVHPAESYAGTTLVHGLLHKMAHLSSLNGEFRAGVVHRLDKDTSGLLLIAKDDNTHKLLSEQLKQHKIIRKYLAIVYGIVKDDEGIIDAPIKRHPKDRLKNAVVEDGKEAITYFKTLERFSNASLLELELKTGRTHQIRVHLQFINYPVIGDPIYGIKSLISPTGQYLHAFYLSFIHPITKKEITKTVDLPNSFKSYLETLK